MTAKNLQLSLKIFTGPGSIFFQDWPEYSERCQKVCLDEGAEEGESAVSGLEQPNHAHSSSHRPVWWDLQACQPHNHKNLEVSCTLMRSHQTAHTYKHESSYTVSFHVAIPAVLPGLLIYPKYTDFLSQAISLNGF